LGRSVGKTINEFKNGAKEMTESMKDEISKGDPKVKATEPMVSAQISPALTVSQPTTTTAKAIIPPVLTGSFCVQCGESNPADARFCKGCGKPLAQ